MYRCFTVLLCTECFVWIFRNQSESRGGGHSGYQRQPYNDRNSQQWRDGNRDNSGYRYGRRDQFLPKDNDNRVRYAGVHEHSSTEAPSPKYRRHSNDRQSHYWCVWCIAFFFSISEYHCHSVLRFNNAVIVCHWDIRHTL